MKIDAKALLRALKIAGKVIDKRSTMLILRNVFFAHDTLISTNLDTWITINLSAFDTVLRPAASTCVSHKALTDALKGATGDLILDDQGILVVGRATQKLETTPPADWPKHEIKWERDLGCFGDDFRTAVKQAETCSSHDESRSVLNGINVQGDEATHVTGTDGHRLCTVKVARSWKGKNVTLNQRAVQAILASNGELRVYESSDGKHLRFASGAMTIDTALIDGQFPDYAQAIPPNEKDRPRVTGDRRLLLQTFERFAKFVTMSGTTMVLNGKLSIFADKKGTNEQRSEVLEVETSGETTCCVNPRYVAEALKICSAQEVTISFGKPGATANQCPLRIDDTSATIIIMPMRK